MISIFFYARLAAIVGLLLSVYIYWTVGFLRSVDEPFAQFYLDVSKTAHDEYPEVFVYSAYLVPKQHAQLIFVA